MDKVKHLKGWAIMSADGDLKPYIAFEEAQKFQVRHSDQWVEVEIHPVAKEESAKAEEKALKLSFFRRIMCRLSMCDGHIEHERDAKGVWWIGLRCALCRKFLSPVKSKYQDR